MYYEAVCGASLVLHNIVAFFVSPFRLAVASACALRREIDAVARRKGRTIGATVADRLTWSAVSGLPVPFAELEPRQFFLGPFRI